jgi:signal transduction histidine kinase
LAVTDDGVGGARVAAGGGLAGLLERVHTVDGRLDVKSPAGGPTTITIELPRHA